MYDYFYGAEAEQFSFYRIPKVLFTEERFRSVSAEAKVLYGLLLDRMSLSCKNGWLDQAGRVYIIFTIEEVMTALGCADQKAGKLLHERRANAASSSASGRGWASPTSSTSRTLWIKLRITLWITHRAVPRPPRNHDSRTVKITIQEQ